MAEPRTWKYGLTADEWLHLAAEGPDSEVQPCCGDIGQLRDVLNAMVTEQGEGGYPWLAGPFLEAYGAALNSHDTLADRAKFPLLHRVLEGTTAEAAAHEAGMAENRAWVAQVMAEREASGSVTGRLRQDGATS
jgi:hypothetical protein